MCFLISADNNTWDFGFSKISIIETPYVDARECSCARGDVYVFDTWIARVVDPARRRNVLARYLCRFDFSWLRYMIDIIWWSARDAKCRYSRWGGKRCSSEISERNEKSLVSMACGVRRPFDVNNHWQRLRMRDLLRSFEWQDGRMIWPGYCLQGEYPNL